ncbi:hypothetical protein FRX31_010091 [Thalictrum thalictroides]|uniref:Uncharacterized protein n=1 Tax=Thalictrum thalictroides TaxID=46969 RepID=A0A7J6WSG7_THATH|nr:hypothetical protein FRX31_010091 [Thalictrum thalictroides]
MNSSSSRFIPASIKYHALIARSKTQYGSQPLPSGDHFDFLNSSVISTMEGLQSFSEYIQWLCHIVSGANASPRIQQFCMDQARPDAFLADEDKVIDYLSFALSYKAIHTPDKKERGTQL